jgi:hypothetical protein
MKTKTQEYITIIGVDDRKKFRSLSTAVAQVTVPLEKLQEKLQEELSRLTKALSAVVSSAKSVGDYELQEVVFNAEITVSGNISLLGSGVATGTKGAVQLKFVRPDASK